MTTTAPEHTPSGTPLAEGRVVAIAGPVVDAEFPPHALPEINMAVQMDLVLDGQKVTVTEDSKATVTLDKALLIPAKN